MYAHLQDVLYGKKRFLSAGAGERSRACHRPDGDDSVIPWYIWCCVAAVSSSAIGGVWDISWHKSVGRDSFWTPAHMLIYLCGVLAGVACGYLILATTLRKDSPLRRK